MVPIQSPPNMNKVLGIVLAGGSHLRVGQNPSHTECVGFDALSLVNPRVNPVTLAGLFKRGTSNVLSNQGLWYTSL